MARGNWRSGKDHGPAEVGSARKIVDGYVLKKSGSFNTKEEAYNSALRLRRDGYFVRVVKGTKLYNVWRSYRRIRSRMRWVGW